jgi:hypothetical protein
MSIDLINARVASAGSIVALQGRYQSIPAPNYRTGRLLAKNAISPPQRP